MAEEEAEEEEAEEEKPEEEEKEEKYPATPVSRLKTPRNFRRPSQISPSQGQPKEKRPFMDVLELKF